MKDWYGLDFFFLQKSEALVKRISWIHVLLNDTKKITEIKLLHKWASSMSQGVLGKMSHSVKGTEPGL